METSGASIYASDEEVRSYRIHVSSKYLDLTKKKLELTRLPHELLLPKPREWELGTIKAEIEPLVDFWLEHYSWRTREAYLNSGLAQFRTSISITSSPHPLRIHFIHLRSPHKHAIPLLLIPSFPLTNFPLQPLFAPLLSPPSSTSSQPFHLVVPSIPGLGFSDAFQTDVEDGVVSNTAAVFDVLMRRLGYAFYLASATGSGRDSVAGLDYHLLRVLGEEYRESCLGVHLIEPIVERPTFGKEPLAWMKFTVARFFHAPIFGYEQIDLVALRETAMRKDRLRAERREVEERPLLSGSGGYGTWGVIGLREPNTFSYALCDSPAGLLSLVCSALRRRSPGHQLSNTDIIDLTQLAWLPGPEAGMRFWTAAAQELQGLRKGKRTRSRVAITVFGADGSNDDYICPAWARKSHEVLFAQRASGKAGLAIRERTDVLVDGIRALAKAIDGVDGRLKIMALEEVVVPVEEIVAEESGEDNSLHGMQLDVESPDTVVAVDMN